jgi:hypothetical protein
VSDEAKSLIEETDDGLQANIGQTTIRLILKQGSKMRVKVVYDPEGEILFNNVYGYGWWDHDNQRLHIRNQLQEKLSGDDYASDAEWWADEYMNFIYELSEYVDDAQDETLPSSVDVKRIIDNTERVVVYPGETTEWHVMMHVSGREATLEFDEGEMSANKPKPLKEEYSRVFYETPDIEENAEWKEVRNYWQGIQEVADPVNFTAVDIAVEQFVEKLTRWIRVVDDAAAVKNGDETVWYDGENERGRGNSVDKSVLWVKRAIVQDVHDKLNNDIEIAKLAKELQTRGYTIQTSARLQLEGFKTRYWFFDAEKLDVDETDVIKHSESEKSADRSVEA